MANQTLAGRREQAVLTANRTAAAPKAFVERMRDAISTNIGLYEIRMNLFLWGLFRTGRNKDN